MKTIDNTVLVTGGSSGIGFALAQILSVKGNKVIITGRSETTLQTAISKLRNAHYYVIDASNEAEVYKLANHMLRDFPDLNMIINNAGLCSFYELGTGSEAYQNAGAEIMTNYLSPILLTGQLLSILTEKRDAAIINISSIAAYSPNITIPTYSASKAALHSYTQALRLTLSNTNVRVFEAFPPMVDTAFSARAVSDQKLSPEFVAASIINGIEADRYDIRIGATEDLYQQFLHSPEEALLKRNGFATQED